MNNLIFSLNATIPIFLTMIIGYILRQCHYMDDSFVNTLNKFNYNITLPVLLFLDIYNADFYEVWDTRYVLYCFFVTLACCLLITLLSILFLKDKTILGEFIQASYRGSAAVLGLAFIQNIYGFSRVTPLMIIGTVPLYNIYAVIILSLTNPAELAKGTHSLNKAHFKKTLAGIAKNPIIIGIFLGMAASLTKLALPEILLKTAKNFSNLATPLALIGLGAAFEGKKALNKMAPTLAASFIRLMVQPALFLPLAFHIGFRGEEMVAILVMLGAPTTASCFIMAKNLGHEGVLTSSTVVATTFLSSVTLTFWLFLLKTKGLI